MYRQDRVIVTFMIRLCCEGDSEIELQCYSEAWVTSIFMVGVCFKSQGLG